MQGYVTIHFFYLHLSGAGNLKMYFKITLTFFCIGEIFFLQGKTEFSIQ